MEENAQGAIEYLLIIGAAVIIAVIVIALMMSLSQEGTGAAEGAEVGGQFDEALDIKDCEQLNDDCLSDATNPVYADANRTGKACYELTDRCKQ